MTTAMTPPTNPISAATLEKVLLDGNLAGLNSAQRVEYMQRVCETLGLNPLTKPFEFLTFQGKMVMYARRDCTEQLRKIHGVSVTISGREVVEGCYIVTARAQDAAGRHDESIGAVSIDGLKGEARSNAMMKAETKAKRRVTLSVCGLGMLDESETDSIPGAKPAPEYIPPANTNREAAPAEGKAPAVQIVPSVAGAGKPPRAPDVKHDGSKATKEQIAKLHILLNDTGLACKGNCAFEVQEYSKKAGGLVKKTKLCTYHTQLAAFKDQVGKSITTSTNLSVGQMSNLLDRYERKAQRKETRADEVPVLDIQPQPNLHDRLATAFEGDAEAMEAWVHGNFGVSHVQELPADAVPTAFALLAAFSDPDKYDQLEAEARTRGLIR